MNPINKRVALCSQLNMNFEEANELFDNESLESMQMAKVNGGSGASIAVLARIATIVQFIAGIAGVVSCVHTILSERELKEDETTPEINSLEQLSKKITDILKTNPERPIEMTADSIVDNKVYGYKLIIGVPTLDK